MDIWWIIVTAIVVTTVLRITPALLTNPSISKPKWFLDFLDYAACSAIGSMIYVSAFYRMQHTDTIGKSSALIICNVLILIIAFLLSLKLKKPIRVFSVCIILYAVANIIIFS